ncbi:MAG: TolC family protein [Gammaproteobacteria bacterium]|nr:TolC family protein [Gammaproteobacteria bacterium]
MIKRFLFAFSLLLLSGVVNALTLTQAYEKAIRYDAGYAAVKELLQASEEQRIQANAQLKPQVKLSLTKRNESYQLPNSTTLKSDYNENSSSQYVQLSQPIYNRRLFLGVDLAEKRLSLAELQSLQSLQDLTLRVAEAYFATLLYQENIELDRLQLETTLTRIDQVKAAMQVGYASVVDVYGLQAELDEVSSRKVLHEQQLLVARQELAILIGEDPPNFIKFPSINTPELLAVLMPTMEALVRAVDDNLAVKGKILGADIASVDLAVRRAESYPVLNLGAVYSNTQASSYFAQKNDNQLFYLELSLPLYEGGYATSRVREGEARLRSSQQEAIFAKRNALKRIKESASLIQSSSERIKATEKAIESASLYLDSVEEGFRLGLRDMTELSRAKEKLFSSRRDKIESVIRVLNGLVKLYAETGMLDRAVMVQLDRLAFQ